MKIIKKIEYNITPILHGEITRLKNDCFPEHSKPRSYFKQLPHFRFLAYEDDKLVGHMGVDHRVISVGESIFTIFGVIDLCVSSQYERRGIASKMLCKVSSLATQKGIDFLFLVADNHKLYEKNGFLMISTFLSWLRISDHKNYGVAVERIENELMIKQIGSKAWPDEPVDLLGYLF